MESEMKTNEVRNQRSEVRSKERKGICIFLLLFTLNFSLFTVVAGCGQKTDEGGVRKSLPNEGDVASSFSLKLLGGKEFKLGDEKGKVVVINFFASWCHPCKTEAPALEKVYENYKDKGVLFIGIAIQDKEANVRGYVKEFGIRFPVGIDSAGNIAEAYKIYGIPKTFIIDKDGRFSYIHMGEITEHDLINEVEKALK